MYCVVGIRVERRSLDVSFLVPLIAIAIAIESSDSFALFLQMPMFILPSMYGCTVQSIVDLC